MPGGRQIDCLCAWQINSENKYNRSEKSLEQSRNVQRGFSVQSQFVDSLKNVKIILVGTTHAGNIGATARVMKNMSLEKLTLVDSTDCGPDTEAKSMSSGAYGIVENATVCGSLRESLQDTVMSVATSGRLGSKRTSSMTPEDLAPEILKMSRLGEVAIVFGRESRGLTNTEFTLCDHHMIIPTDSGFASMNLAQSVAVTAYEIFKAACKPVGFQVDRFKPVDSRTREEMYTHIEAVLLRSAFLNTSNPLRMMREIRRILDSARLDSRDAKIIRGVFRKIDGMIRTADKKIRNLSDSLEKFCNPEMKI